MIFLHSNEIMH